jgi:hypothetical protein
MSQDSPQILKCGSVSEWSGSHFVELGGISEVIDGLTPYASRMAEGRPAGKKTWVQFGAALGQRQGVNGELLVPDSGCNTNQFGIVRNFVWEKWKHLKSLLESLGAKPYVRSHQISFTQRKKSEIPHCRVIHVRRVVLQHDLCDLRLLECAELVSQVDLELAERDHRCGMENAGDQVSLVEGVPAFKGSAGFREIPHL